MNITVYLGANEGNDNRLREAVQALGHWGIGLVKAAMHWYMAARKQG